MIKTKQWKFFVAFVYAVFFSVPSLVFAQTDSVTITTYYPAPAGAYREMFWGNFPNTRGILVADQGSSIELGGSGTPYIDFHNDMVTTNDYDMRIILRSDNDLVIEGGAVGINAPNTNTYIYDGVAVELDVNGYAAANDVYVRQANGGAGAWVGDAIWCQAIAYNDNVAPFTTPCPAGTVLAAATNSPNMNTGLIDPLDFNDGYIVCCS